VTSLGELRQTLRRGRAKPGAKAPPHADADDGPPAIARYGPQASVSQESTEPIWALLQDLPREEGSAR